MKLSAQDWQVALAVCIGSINHGQHMKITPISFIWISFLFISGCADNLPIIKSGTNFMCDGHTGYWKEWSLGTGGRQIQEKCEMAAEDCCAKQGKNMTLLMPGTAIPNRIQSQKHRFFLSVKARAMRLAILNWRRLIF